MLKKVCTFLLLLILGGTTATHAKRPISFDDVVKVERISGPQVSPDGRWVAYVKGTVDVEANKTSRHIWLVPTAGGEPRQLTRGEG